MEKELLKEKWAEYLAGAISTEEWEAYRESLSGDPDLEKELKSLESLWSFMDELPEAPDPAPAMHDRFYNTLAQMKRSSSRVTPAAGFNIMELLSWRRLALGLSVFIIGGACGYFLSPSNDYKAEISSLSSEMKNMKEMMLLTLIEKPAAQDRLRAVSLSEELPEADSRVIGALVQTLRTDPNVNVRLVTVEALARFGKYPEVREALVDAISEQDSPLVQITLANAMVALNEKNAVDKLRQLLTRENLNETVRQKVEESIEVLI